MINKTVITYTIAFILFSAPSFANNELTAGKLYEMEVNSCMKAFPKVHNFPIKDEDQKAACKCEKRHKYGDYAEDAQKLTQDLIAQQKKGLAVEESESYKKIMQINLLSSLACYKNFSYEKFKYDCLQSRDDKSLKDEIFCECLAKKNSAIVHKKSSDAYQKYSQLYPASINNKKLGNALSNALSISFLDNFTNTAECQHLQQP